ncbi:hypothetical protein OLK001_18570 [Synechocystis sp. LKSZ1]
MRVPTPSDKLKHTTKRSNRDEPQAKLALGREGRPVGESPNVIKAQPPKSLPN